MLAAWNALISVMEFEFRRTLSPVRIATWLVLALFPLVLVVTARRISESELPEDVATIATYVLVPQLTCTLALLLWATPTLQAEVEGQTWIYMAMRPLGRTAGILGKYLVAVCSAASAGLVAAVACALATGTEDWLQLMSTLCALVLLSSLSYGAVYTLIGVVVYRRAMVFAVGYTLGVEVLFSLIPATVNKLTVSYRLRGLLFNWHPIALPDDAAMLMSTESSTAHVSQLMLYTVIMLTAAIAVSQTREVPVGGDA
jgi:ABC-type transport system involved in multi-copper enzyme maturation permease subunit